MAYEQKLNKALANMRGSALDGNKPLVQRWRIVAGTYAHLIKCGGSHSSKKVGVPCKFYKDF